MTTIAEDVLPGLIDGNDSLSLIEPHIYSAFPDVDIANDYDTGFGIVYDLVACNSLYNRLIWGYSIARFASLVHDALRISAQGAVLDLGCGSLAFTARTYIDYSDRPVVLMDQSLRMLRIARSRVLKLNGKVPGNMVFLRADAMRLPFLHKSFDTIISLNLLHCLDDTRSLIGGLKNVLSDGGKMYFTTLVKGDRFADRYLKALADGGKLVSRTMEQHHAVFEDLGLSMRYDMSGNMAFMYTG